MASRKKKNYWFAAKKYGWGWYPVTPEGWAVLITYFVVVFANYFRIDANTKTTAETLGSWIPETFILSFFLIYICLKKGEDPRRK